VFLPLHDGLALRHLERAIVTILIVVANIAIFAAETAGILGPASKVDVGLGLIPAVITGKAVVSPELAVVPSFLTPVTSMFLHGGFFHLAGNLMFLWVFGDNVEDAMGHLRFAAFYLVCGVCAGLTYVYMFPDSRNPLIGASGAISGVAAAYLLLYPRSRVFGLLLNWIPARAPSVILIGLWVAYQIYFAFAGGDAQIGWWAHAGGIIAGAVLLPVFRHWKPAPPEPEDKPEDEPDDKGQNAA
jgi:membrane associated rhomboid family serine protease